jgi:hypothetical protein
MKRYFVSLSPLTWECVGKDYPYPSQLFEAELTAVEIARIENAINEFWACQLMLNERVKGVGAAAKRAEKEFRKRAKSVHGAEGIRMERAAAESKATQSRAALAASLREEPARQDNPTRATRNAIGGQ